MDNSISNKILIEYIIKNTISSGRKEAFTNFKIISHEFRESNNMLYVTYSYNVTTHNGIYTESSKYIIINKNIIKQFECALKVENLL